MPGEQISLIGIPSNGNTVFSSIVPGHELPMEPGNHLRWFFRPELGFPEKFTLYRGGAKDKLRGLVLFDITSPSYFQELLFETVQENLEQVAEFSFAPLESPIDFFSKGDPNRNGPPQEYLAQVDGIQAELAVLLDASNAIPQFDRHFAASVHKKARIKPIHALLLASMDPYLARLMGVYFIDRYFEDVAGYYVVADYGTREYPLNEFNFRTIPPARFGTVGYKIGDCTLFCVVNQLLQSYDPATKGALFIDPNITGTAIIALSFENPVEEVHLSFEGAIYGNFRVVLENGQTLPLELQNNQLIISPPAETSSAFKILTIFFEHIGRIPMVGLAYREKRGSIGQFLSNIYMVDRALNYDLPRLEITALRQATMPPILDANGRLNTQINKVKAAVGIEVTDGPFQLTIMAMPQPVRYVFSKREGFNDAPPEGIFRPEEPAILSPVDPTFLGLLLFFNFNKKNFTNLADDLPAIVKGRFEFSNPVFRAIDLGTINLNNFPLFSGGQYLLLRDFEPLRRQVNSFTIGATVYPMVLADGGYMTILDYNWQTSLWFGLVRRGDRLFVHVVLNGNNFDSVQSIELAKQPPHRLIVAYSGWDLKIYIDAMAPETFPARIGPIAHNPNGLLAIGADINSQGEGAPESLFNGHLNDVYFWAKAMNPYEVKNALVDNGDKLLPKEIDSLYTRNPFSYSDLFVADGDYTYFTKGIDIFGRMSAWGRPERIAVRATLSKPNAPQSVKATFIPLRGSVVSYNETTKRLMTDIQGTANFNQDLLSHDIEIPRELSLSNLGKDMPPIRPANAPPISDEDGIPATKNYLYRQKFEIAATAISDILEIIELKIPPFARYEPRQGDTILLPFDRKVQVEWQWTGLQQVYNPHVDRFNVYHLPGIQNQVEATVASVVTISDTAGIYELQVINGSHFLRPNVFNDHFCDINHRSYKVIEHDGGNTTRIRVHYEGTPLIVPQPNDRLYINIQEGEPDYVDLKELTTWGTAINLPMQPERFEPITNAGTTPAIAARKLPAAEINERLREGVNKIDWIPLADEKTDLWELAIHGLSKPNGYQDPEPADYVPDALVAAVRQESGETKYEVLYILWRTWDDNGVLRLYTSLAQQPPGKDESSTPQPPYVPDFAVGMPLLFYPGRKFSATFDLPGRAVPAGRSTEMHQFTVTAFAPANGTSPPASYASLVAVDRSKPPPAPKPEVSKLGKADYHNLSDVTISWALNPQIAYYQLFRATDSDIFTTDLEHRRLKVGVYKSMSDADILGGPDGDALLRVFRHKSPASFAQGLTGDYLQLSIAHLLGHAKGSPAWNYATPFWLYWAGWYYPSLRIEENTHGRPATDEIQALAELDGNESAFTLVHSSPIKENSYPDKVNGAVNNRYYYRLRSQGLNLNQSTQWGPVSDGEKAEAPSVPPRTPVFTKVEAGDRQVTLQWALNREADLQGYVLYRSQQKELLEDLRWFDAEFPRGNALVHRTEIPDPRIVVRNRQIVISDDTPIQSIVGVYRAEEFDFNLPLGERQVQAVNFWTGGATLPAHDATNHTYTIRLGRVADGVEMVVVVRNNLNNFILINYSNISYPFVDIIESRTKVNYRIVADAESGKRSLISQLTTGISF